VAAEIDQEHGREQQDPVGDGQRLLHHRVESITIGEVFAEGMNTRAARSWLRPLVHARATPAQRRP
jgi:hypothetical protein